jgi:hypothetical protein
VIEDDLMCEGCPRRYGARYCFCPLLLNKLETDNAEAQAYPTASPEANK